MPTGIYIRTEEHKRNLSLALKNKIMSEEHRKRISESLKDNICYKNPERSKHISEGCKGRIPWNRGARGLQVAWNKGKHTNSISIQKMVKTRMLNGSYAHSPESIDKIRSSIIKGIGNREIRRYETDLEKIIKEFYGWLGINYIYQYNFNNKFIVDFAIPEEKLVVECDGEYWHSSEKQLKRDKARDAYIQSCGWRVMRLRGKAIYLLGKRLPLLKSFVESVKCAG